MEELRIQGYMKALTASPEGGKRYLEYERARGMASLPQTWVVPTDTLMPLPIGPMQEKQGSR